MFRLLRSSQAPGGELEPGPPELIDINGYPDYESALAGAKDLCQRRGRAIIIMQEVAEVQMAPAVVSLSAPISPPQGAVFRGETAPSVDTAAETPRVPRATPRLLVVEGRRATVAELFGHLMVVAEGRIVKNAFGALELADMPLSAPELVEVTAALKVGA